MKLLYLDCFSGVAGDMLLASLLDAGASEEHVRGQLARLDLQGWSLETETVTRRGFRALRSRVTVEDPQPDRRYRDIVALIERSRLDERVEARALETFMLLARAEARVHGVTLDEVHLHEVAAVDAIVDIVGCAAALESLAPDRVVTSPIATGRGTIESAHGEIPVPAPAVVELLAEASLVERGTEELVTPTGAALVAAASDAFGEMPALRVRATGYGAGSRDSGALPNVVRAIFGDALDVPAVADSYIVETNIDDMSPELIPYVIERVMAAGAQDAWVAPIVMKKGRPAFLLSALVTEAERDDVVDAIYRETTTLGVRVSPTRKDELERSWIEVEVSGHAVRVKLGHRAGEIVTASPEHDDAVKAARATGMALKDVYAVALRNAFERDHRT